MKLNAFVPCPELGCHLMAVDWNGGPFLTSVAMLTNGGADFASGEVDVSKSAFDADELADFCAKAADVLEATPAEVEAAIRG